MSRTSFRVNPHAVVALMSRNSLFETGTASEIWVAARGFDLDGKRKLNTLF